MLRSGRADLLISTARHFMTGPRVVTSAVSAGWGARTRGRGTGDPGLPSASVGAEQIRRDGVERLRDPGDRPEGHVPLAALDGPDVGPVQAALLREGFLGQPDRPPSPTDIPPEERIEFCPVHMRNGGRIAPSFPLLISSKTRRPH